MIEEDCIVKILVRATDLQHPSAVKVEFLSEKDFFFLYQHNCDHELFSEMNAKQQLKFGFPAYLEILIKLFNRCKEDGPFKCNMQINEDNTADFYFNQVVMFKTINLLCFKCFQEKDDTIKKHIKYRH